MFAILMVDCRLAHAHLKALSAYKTLTGSMGTKPKKLEQSAAQKAYTS
jgi:hypothetical protein